MRRELHVTPATPATNKLMAWMNAARLRPAVKPAGPVVRTHEQWIIAVKFYQQHGAWSADGPSPDCYGCQAPADVLEMYGYGPGRRR